MADPRSDRDPDLRLLAALAASLVLLTVVPPAAGQCGDPGAGPCCEANGSPGCDDADACNAVCDDDPFCCEVKWDGNCVQALVQLFGPGFCFDPPLEIATGPNSGVDGFLSARIDEYGSHGSWDPNGDWQEQYNPAGPPGLASAAFSAGQLFFREAAAQREALSRMPAFNNFWDDESIETAVTSDPPQVATDTNGDGVDDTTSAQFSLTGDGIDLTVDVVNHVGNLSGPAGSAIAVLTTEYAFTDNTGAGADFNLLAYGDYDMTWDAMGDLSTDSVGTGTNDGADCDRFVFQEEEGLEGATAVTISASGSLASGAAYVGAKNLCDPDGPGPGPAMGQGTSNVEWNDYGLPDTWTNYVAGVGYDTDGVSGASPACNGIFTFDAHIALEIPVVVPAGGSTTVVVARTYGANTPFGQDCSGGGNDCPADIDGNGVVGVLDLSDVILAWGPCPGCPEDIDGDGSVAVLDLSAVILAWGPCP